MKIKLQETFHIKTKINKNKKSISKVKWPTEFAPRNSVHVVIA